uniref:Bacteriophage protein n=1 Tax=Heterorhabditis bacteriophora TaxID=37862 RepID=A0A1I7XHW2_HETBA
MNRPLEALDYYRQTRQLLASSCKVDVKYVPAEKDYYLQQPVLVPGWRMLQLQLQMVTATWTY